jgi:two-component system, cell cycle response regulator
LKRKITSRFIPKSIGKREIMNERERGILRELTEQLERVTRGDDTPSHPLPSEVPEFKALEESIARLGGLLAEARAFISALSQGRLDIDPPPRNPLIAPFKQMHANLRHLTWQTRQIAAGDLDQHVDFLGAFSVAFNSMTESLREKRVAEEKILYLSMHDSLTGLYNRGYFEEEMARIERGRTFPVSILMADLDGLKRINDTHGHAIGDSLIRDAANILRRAVRSSDVVARLGGDEFALILSGSDAHIAARVVERIRWIESEFNVEPRGYRVSFSIGFATAEKDHPLVETLKIADERMYRDKYARKAVFAQKGEMIINEPIPDTDAAKELFPADRVVADKHDGSSH